MSSIKQKARRQRSRGDEARRLCFGLLGPPPEHPMLDFILHGPNDLMGDDARRWQDEYRWKKTGEEAEASPKKRGTGNG